MSAFAALLVALVLALPARHADGRAGAPQPAYVLIVNAGNGTSSVERAFVRQAFLKKITRWPNGTPIRPVDLDSRSPVRERFSSEVLERSVAAVRSYWQQLIFSGRDVPPPELDDDVAVVRYVQRHPGAIGYVGAGTNLDGTKLLQMH